MQAQDDKRLKSQQQLDEMIRTKDLKRVSELFAPDFVNHTYTAAVTMVPSEQRGYEDFVKNLPAGYKNIPDAHIEVDEVITQGDKFVYRWTFTGTYQGPSLRGRVTGRQESQMGATILQVVDGKVREMWTYVLIPQTLQL